MEQLTLGTIIEALARAREREAAVITAALRDHQVVGVEGLAGSGKSSLLRRVLASEELGSDRAVVYVNLDGTYSPHDLARRWFRAIAKAAAGSIAFSHIVAMERDFWPGSTRRAEHLAREVLREDYDTALASRAATKRSKGGNDDIARAIAATTRLAERPTLLALDHLEAPILSGALDARALLWQVRAASQHHANLAIVMACRPAAVGTAADEDGAFFGDGTWLTIKPPSTATWAEATLALRPSDEDANLGPYIRKRIERIYDLTGGHVWSTALVVQRVIRDQPVDPINAFVALTVEHQAHATRCIEHAATLHRLGPALLHGIANDLGPYQAIPDAQTRDVAAAAQRLELAGLAHRPQPRMWQITDPLVAEALREQPSVDRVWE